ncbi:MAG TPA: hypothetical protein VGC41_23080, partial [Kofleriaceae bacterium]
VACAPKVGTSEVRMIAAPPREASCKLEMVSVDITSIHFNQQWDVLGYVTFLDTGQQDPFAESNKQLVRPRACAMGGSAVAIGMQAMGANQMNQTGSGISYMVLRPKTWTQKPEAF